MVCQGVPKEKAEEMVRLMNIILERQLDPKRVYSQLNQIHNDINALGIKVDPLANAPPAAITLLNKSQRMETACSDFSEAWGRETIERINEYNRERQARAEAHQRSGPGKTMEISDAVAQERAADYEKTLAPELIAWRSQLVSQVPKVSSTQNYTDVKTTFQMVAVCRDVVKIATAYREKSFLKFRASKDISRGIMPSRL